MLAVPATEPDPVPPCEPLPPPPEPPVPAVHVGSELGWVSLSALLTPPPPPPA